MTDIAIQPTASQRRLGLFLVITAGILWSTGAAIARAVDTEPWSTIFWRAVFACLFLCAFVAIRNRGRFLSVFLAMGLPGVVMGLAFATASSSFVIALEYTSAAHVLFLLGVAPFIAAFLGRIFLGERIPNRTWIAMVLALIGVGIMVSEAIGRGNIVGDLLGLLTASCFAVGTVIMRRYRQIEMTAATALAAAFGAIFALTQGVQFVPSLRDIGLLALFGVVQLGLGLALFTIGARHIIAAEAVLCSLLELALGPIWVWIIHGEALGTVAIIGGTIIIFAMVMNTVLDRNQPSPLPPAA
jgi:drug/metabolite transporter (DMT)-like permease